MPKVFVGSSREGLKVAEAIQKELSNDADVTLWSQGIFRTTNIAIEDLMSALNEFDFAVFVFLPEDTVTVRDKKALAVRDNVLFELGLFLGKLGRQRNFFITPKDDAGINLHLPSDLSGITPATYDPAAKNLRAGISPALYEIKESIRTLGTVSKETILYDGRKDFRRFHFAHRNAYIWKDGQKISDKGEGKLQFLPAGVIKVERKNFEGRYEIELRRDGPERPSIAKKHEPVDRVLRVSCESRVDSGKQRLRFILKDQKAKKWVADEKQDVSSTEWTPVEMYFRVATTVDLLLRIDVEKPSQIPSNLYLKSLVVVEEA